ncbi:hypothetical protein, partial [Burkholderia sp. BCC1993]|uniref:hypothetical protein n=1 Tax=Burkholderia sp. BCC1993 TaxID=2817444 RepID=UPI002AB19316
GDGNERSQALESPPFVAQAATHVPLSIVQDHSPVYSLQSSVKDRLARTQRSRWPGTVHTRSTPVSSHRLFKVGPVSIFAIRRHRFFAK